MPPSSAFILYLREKTVAAFTLASLIFFLASTGAIGLLATAAPERIPIRYNIFFGIDSFGLWYRALSYPAIACLFFIVNTSLGYYLYPKDKYSAYFLLVTATLSNFFVLLYAISLLSSRA